MVLKSTTKTKLLLSTLMALTVGVGVVNQHESVVKAEEKNTNIIEDITQVDAEKVTSLDQITDSGSYYITQNDQSLNVLSSFNNNDYYVMDKKGKKALVLHIEKDSDNYYTISQKDDDNGSQYYMYCNGKGKIYRGNSVSGNKYKWEIKIKNAQTGEITIMNVESDTYGLRANSSASKFACYQDSSNQPNVNIYKLNTIVKVTFNPNAGEDEVSYSSDLPTEIEVNENETIPEGYQQLEVHRQGYKFLGWFKETSAENKFDFSLPITEDTTIYAGWEKVTTQHKITFDENGGTPISEKEIQVLENSWIEEEPTTTKDGYKLLGWYVTENGETRKWDFENKEIVTKDITLKAKWILNEADEFTKSAADSRLSVSYTKEETFGVEEFVKVTKPTDIDNYDWSGTYLITSTLSDTTYIYTGLDEAKKDSTGSVVGDKLIVNDGADFAKIVINKIKNNENKNIYSLKIEEKEENCYLSDKLDGKEEKTNGIVFYTDANDAPNTISWSNDYITIKGKNDCYFAMNDTSAGWFRYYKNNTQNPITLYRYNPGTQTNYDVTSTTTGYGLTFNANAHYETAKYGMFLANVDEANKDLQFDVETMDVNKDSDITLDEVKEVLTGKGFGNQQQYTDLNLNKTNEKGEILESGNYYTMGVKFTFNDIEKLPIDDWILAVGYMEVDGQIYFSLPTIHSLRDLVKIYQSNEDFLQQQPDAKGVLNVLGAL